MNNSAFADKVARVIHTQLIGQNARFAQRLCEDLPLDMGLDPFNSWHRRLAKLGLPQSHADFTPGPGSGQVADVLMKHLSTMKCTTEAKFFAGIVAVCDVSTEHSASLLSAWDEALAKIGVDWKQIDFDIAKSIGMSREVAVAA